VRLLLKAAPGRMINALEKQIWYFNGYFNDHCIATEVNSKHAKGIMVLPVA
jgi:hypothetical protein